MIVLRARKLAYSLFHPQCWRGLKFGVAPSIEHREALAALQYDLIIDVGANRGQFSLICRMASPAVPIIAFEPIPAEANVFLGVVSGFKDIQLHQVALGERTGEAVLHLSHSADSSSLLPIGQRQKELFRDTEEVGTLKVPVQKLDDFLAHWERHSRILLKIDVQGFELSVLSGASETLKKCAYVYVECSEVELYLGQALYRDVACFLEQRGFKLGSRYNETVVNGESIQADYLFVRA